MKARAAVGIRPPPPTEVVTFSFGENWRRFLDTLDDQKIASSTATISGFLGRDSLAGLHFLDIGSGSGLSSLAAHRLGARVTSMDVDPHSVGCTAELRRREGSPEDWTVLHGSVLDADFMNWLPSADVVYSWGVLHHTGDLAQALERAVGKLAPGGVFDVALYNRTGASPTWLRVKRLYNRLPTAGKAAMRGFFAVLSWCQMLVHGQWPPTVLRGYARTSRRGMDWWRDLEDWLGGLPYECMTVEETTAWATARGLTVVKCLPDPSIGCNEFLLRRVGERS